MCALLADAYGFLLVDNFLFLRGKNGDDQSRKSEEHPLDGNPPPTDTKPPKDAVMLAFDLLLVHDSHIYIFASALWTFHKNYLFLYLPAVPVNY